MSNTLIKEGHGHSISIPNVFSQSELTSFSSYLMEMRSASLGINVREMITFNSVDTWSFLGKSIFFLTILIKSTRFCADHGHTPYSILYIVTPKLHTSHLILYGSLYKISGDI
jgi:hypothetical protein